MRSLRLRRGVLPWAVSALFVAGPLPPLAAAADGDGYAPPDPPYGAPAVVVTLSWDYQEDVVLLYDATTSDDPIGDWTAGDYAGWGGGCEPGAVTGDEVLPLFLGGGPSEAYYDGLAEAPPAGHGAYNWSEEPGTYTIIVAPNGYCVNPGGDGDERAREMYESILPPGRMFTVTARVERYDPGAASPTDVEILSAEVPMQHSVETATVIGEVIVDPPTGTVETSVETSTSSGGAPAGATPSTTLAGPAPPHDDDPGLLRWLVDPMVWLVVALLFGVGSMLFIFRTVLRGLRPWEPTHAVTTGTAMTEVQAPSGSAGAPLTWGQIPGGAQSVTQDTRVRLVRAVPETGDVIVEFRDGTRARTGRRSLESLETSPSTFRPSHRLVGNEIQGWRDGHDPGADPPDSCLTAGDDRPVEVVCTKGPYTLVRHGYGGRNRMWVRSDTVQVRVHRVAGKPEVRS